jgi:type I restriction enzyme S subunit
VTTFKPSGLGWADNIPAHWDVAKVCLVARLESGHTPSRLHPEYWLPDECTIPWLSLGDVWQLRAGIREYLGETKEKISPLGMANSAARLLPAGTVVLSRTASVGFTGIMPEAMATTQDFANWVCGPRLLPEFLLYAFRGMADEFERMMMGSTHQTIYMPDIRRLAIPVPPREEQSGIVQHLRRRLPKIDALIAKKERLIELLQEKRQALITQAVTKGLDPNVPMKESGVEWLREIPTHWVVNKLRRISNRVDVGIAEAATHAYAEAGVPIVRSTNVANNRFDAEHLLFIAPWFAEKNRSKYLFAGDLVTVRTGNAGVTAVVPLHLDRSQCFTLLMTTLRAQHTPEFFCYLLNCAAGRTYFALESWGTAQLNISVPILGNMKVAVPPPGEQANIVKWLKGRLQRLDRTLTSVETQTDRLREYRQALITAAVTGKIDVSSEAA